MSNKNNWCAMGGFVFSSIPKKENHDKTYIEVPHHNNKKDIDRRRIIERKQDEIKLSDDMLEVWDK